MQMFNEAEIAIFTRVGLAPVFFGTRRWGRYAEPDYMLTFASLAELTERWAAFSADAAWKELSHRPGNADAEIVNNISNLYLESAGLLARFSAAQEAGLSSPYRLRRLDWTLCGRSHSR